MVTPATKQGAISRSQRLFDLGCRRPVPARKNERALMKIFRGKARKIRLSRASGSLILLLLMLPIKSVVNVYPGNISGPYGAQAPWEWHAGPGPNKRGGMCVTHVDLGRGYGYQAPCPAPKKAAAAPAKKKTAAR